MAEVSAFSLSLAMLALNGHFCGTGSSRQGLRTTARARPTRAASRARRAVTPRGRQLSSPHGLELYLYSSSYALNDRCLSLSVNFAFLASLGPIDRRQARPDSSDRTLLPFPLSSLFSLFAPLFVSQLSSNAQRLDFPILHSHASRSSLHITSDFLIRYISLAVTYMAS